jgi:hypothetical protein
MTHVGIGAYTSISLDLGNCGGPLRDVDEADRLFSDLLRRSGMGMRQKLKDTFAGEHGESYMLVYTLEESLLAIQSLWIETWPEKSGVKIVIDLCKFQRDNRDRAIFLAEGCKEIFRPTGGALIVKRQTIEDMDGW